MLMALGVAGCSSFGPSALQQSRLQYNEVVKTTGGQQLLLNIVRLRYTDTPSRLAVSGIAAQFEVSKNFDLTPFNWSLLMQDLFRVYSIKADERPENAHVAVPYRGHWFYIDQTDQDTKSTFSLLLELSRLEILGKPGGGPVLTLPVGTRLGYSPVGWVRIGRMLPVLVPSLMSVRPARLLFQRLRLRRR